MTKTKNLPQKSVRDSQADKCRERINHAMTGANVAFYDMAMGLTEAYENDYAKEWGFENFADYVERELDMKYRSAYYMVQIGQTVRSFGVSKELVQKIGWTKLKEITGVMNDNPDEANKYLEMAESMSTSQLKEALQAEVRLTEAKEAKPAILRLSLKFEGDAAGILSDGLTMAYADIGREDASLGLSHIVGEWLMARGGGAAASTLEDWLSFIKKTFGVTLVKAENEEALDAILTEAFPVDSEAVASDLDEDDALAELLR